jgi:hypothetical protein
VASELVEFELELVPRRTIKSQALLDFMTEWTLDLELFFGEGAPLGEMGPETPFTGQH